MFRKITVFILSVMMSTSLCFADSITNFPNGVSSFGIPIVPGMELGKVWGNTYFVDTATGSDDNDCKSPDMACATIQEALDLCTTGKGDRVYVRDGAYAETLTMSKNGVMLIGQSLSGVVVTGDTDATDTCSVTGNEVTIANMSFAPYDAGADISLIKTTGDGTRVQNCSFSGGEYQIENVGGDNCLVVGCSFITLNDVTDGACMLFEDANDCKVLGCNINIDANSDGIVHHDADNLEVGWCSAVGDDDTGASIGAFIYIVGEDATSELSVHDCQVTLFGALLGESSAAVAAHGYGTGDLAVTATVDSMEVDNTYHGNDALGCTLFFDTTGL